MDEDLKDYLNCPVCFGVPENEVFQCPDGHTVCGSCIRNLESCPQCRAPYDGRKIRNRALEAMLNLHDFECHFKELGCAEMSKRKELNRHIHHCKFNFEAIRLCQLIGYKNCTFAPGFTRNETVYHYEIEHGALVRCGRRVRICLDNFPRVQEECENLESKLLTPLILNLEGNDSGPVFLILSNINPHGFLSLACVQIWRSGGSNSPSANFLISLSMKNEKKCIDGKRKAPNLSFVVTPIVRMEHAEGFLKAFPLNIPVSLISGNFMNPNRDCVVIDIGVEEHSIPFQETDGRNNMQETWIVCPAQVNQLMNVSEACAPPDLEVEVEKVDNSPTEVEAFPNLPTPGICAQSSTWASKAKFRKQ